MADPQPEGAPPADGVRDRTRVDDGSEPSTVDAPARWSGSAAVPAPSARKQWWRRDHPEPEEPTPADPWLTTPPVDPWAGQDTAWEPYPVVVDETAAPAPMPPTRVEPPAPTMVESPAGTASPPPATAPTPPPAAPKPPSATSAPPAPAPAATRPASPANAPELSRRQRRKAAKAQRPPSPPVAPTIQGRPLPPAPPWAPRPVNRPMPPPPRRRRRWGRRFALLGLLGVVCCCGVPFAWFQLPTARQYPVSAALPKTFADLKLRDTEETGPDGFAGVYRDGRGKRVTVFGETGFRLTPGSDVRARLEQAAADYQLRDIESFDLGEFGAHESCGVGRENGTSVVVCAWADHGSVATVLLTRRSVADSAELVGRLREEVLSPG
ncbi:hypothetical protein [Actinoplanes sp. URMC 104]|uniref:hypothetical protein n=1 Tax=Actinoplanes sp. URMC 104 TaxID=3423409 RepID=UPI003F1B0B81